MVIIAMTLLMGLSVLIILYEVSTLHVSFVLQRACLVPWQSVGQG